MFVAHSTKHLTSHFRTFYAEVGFSQGKLIKLIYCDFDCMLLLDVDIYKISHIYGRTRPPCCCYYDLLFARILAYSTM